LGRREGERWKKTYFRVEQNWTSQKTLKRKGFGHSGKEEENQLSSESGNDNSGMSESEGGFYFEKSLFDGEKVGVGEKKKREEDCNR